MDKLGLTLPKEYPHSEEIALGTAKIGSATVDVFVQAWPAKFWRFMVTDIEGHKWEINTGSGSLSGYWPSVVHVAQACFCVERKP